MLFHVNCFSKFKLSKQTIWEIRQNPILMILLRSWVLYCFQSVSLVFSHLDIIHMIKNNSRVLKNLHFTLFLSESSISNHRLFWLWRCLVLKSKMTYCSSYVRELSVCGPRCVPLFWYEGVFDGGSVLFLG